MLNSRLNYWRRQYSLGCLFITLLLILAPNVNRAQDKPTAEDELLRKASQENQGTSGGATEDRSSSISLEAQITEVSGKHVQFSRDGGKTWQMAKKGVKLTRTDSVRTGFASRCELSFADHTVAQIQPLSAFKVSEYTATVNSAKVRANLYYGAVRCGVVRGRIKADVRISTPVSTLSIRGTLVSVEYDPGTQLCMMRVDEDGPALAAAAAVSERGCRNCPDRIATKDPNQIYRRQYELVEGMNTDCELSRYLELAIFERAVWVTGSYEVGDVTTEEAEAIVYDVGIIEPTDGSLQYNDDRSRDNQRVSDEIIDYHEGDIPIGDVQY